MPLTKLKRVAKAPTTVVGGVVGGVGGVSSAVVGGVNSEVNSLTGAFSERQAAVKYPPEVHELYRQRVIQVFNLPPRTPMKLRLVASGSAYDTATGEWEDGELIITRKNVAFLSAVGNDRAILRSDIRSCRKGRTPNDPMLTVKRADGETLMMRNMTLTNQTRAIKIIGHLIKEEVKHRRESRKGGLNLSSLRGFGHSRSKSRGDVENSVVEDDEALRDMEKFIASIDEESKDEPTTEEEEFFSDTEEPQWDTLTSPRNAGGDVAMMADLDESLAAAESGAWHSENKVSIQDPFDPTPSPNEVGPNGEKRGAAELLASMKSNNNNNTKSGKKKSKSRRGKKNAERTDSTATDSSITEPTDKDQSDVPSDQKADPFAVSEQDDLEAKRAAAEAAAMAEHQRLEKERSEELNNQAEADREKELKEQEAREAEAREQERIEREKLEQAAAEEQKRKEQEAEEAARAEKEKLEKEKAEEAARLAQEREMAEQARLAEERDAAALAAAALAREEAERAERERLEREEAEKQARLAKEREAAELAAREEAERAEKERLAREKAEQEALLAKEREAAERQAAEEAERAEKERLAREKAEEEARVAKEREAAEREAAEQAEREAAKQRAAEERAAQERAMAELKAKEAAALANLDRIRQQREASESEESQSRQATETITPVNPTLTAASEQRGGSKETEEEVRSSRERVRAVSSVEEEPETRGDSDDTYLVEVKGRKRFAPEADADSQGQTPLAKEVKAKKEMPKLSKEEQEAMAQSAREAEEKREQERLAAEEQERMRLEKAMQARARDASSTKRQEEERLARERIEQQEADRRAAEEAKFAEEKRARKERLAASQSGTGAVVSGANANKSSIRGSSSNANDYQGVEFSREKVSREQLEGSASGQAGDRTAEEQRALEEERAREKLARETAADFVRDGDNAGERNAQESSASEERNREGFARGLVTGVAVGTIAAVAATAGTRTASEETADESSRERASRENASKGEHSSGSREAMERSTDANQSAAGSSTGLLLSDSQTSQDGKNDKKDANATRSTGTGNKQSSVDELYRQSIPGGRKSSESSTNENSKSTEQTDASAVGDRQRLVRDAAAPSITGSESGVTHRNAELNQLVKGSLGHGYRTLGKSDLWPLLERYVIPKLSHDMHKGQAGKVGVVGGSFEYTGAPYYCAFSALKAGADLAFVFCTEAAAVPIKAYSPELIVYPVLATEESQVQQSIQKTSELMERLSVLVIGPGLGRDPATLKVVKGLIRKTVELDMPLVLDGDALWLLSQDRELLQGHPNVTLLPNAVEYQRLCTSEGQNVEGVAHALNAAVVKKGAQDEFALDGYKSSCDEQNSARRCGGQGDTLAGSMAVFQSWLWARRKEHQLSDDDWKRARLAACLGACTLVRQCNQRAFQKHHRGTTTVEMIQEIPQVFYELFDEAA